MIDKSEFKSVAVGHTLILEHPEIPGYLIKLPLVKDNNMIEGEENVYQNVSRVPNWIAAKQALSTPYALEQGYHKEIALPDEKYFWYIGDIRNHERETPSTPLSDDNYVVLSSKVSLSNPSFKPMMIEQMSERQKLAIKYLIIHGKFWDVSPSNTNFTADGRFAYIDMEQPNNSLAKNFYATDAAKELWNTHAGLMNLDKLLGYPFAKADDETILKLREKILQLNSCL